jgi:hypothetical protein
MFTARHRSLPPTRTEDWTIEDRPRRLVRPIGIRKALGCRQAGRVQGGPPQSGPGRPARILAELRKCLRARYVGTSGADTITRICSFGIGQSPARAALAMASRTGIGPPGVNGGYGSNPAVAPVNLDGAGGWVSCGHLLLRSTRAGGSEPSPEGGWSKRGSPAPGSIFPYARACNTSRTQIRKTCVAPGNEASPYGRHGNVHGYLSD